MILIPVSQLTSRSDHFHCAPLHGSMSAATCVDRQRSERVWRNSKMRTHAFPTGQSCALGGEVRAKVGDGAARVVMNQSGTTRGVRR